MRLVFLFLPPATRSIPYDTARATSASGNSVEILWKGLRVKERVLTMAADAAALGFLLLLLTLTASCSGRRVAAAQRRSFIVWGRGKSGAAARVLS